MAGSRIARRYGLRTEAGVAHVVAVILMVAITVTLTAFLAVFVMDLGSRLREPAPHLMIMNVGPRVSSWDFEVTADRVVPLDQFSVQVVVEGRVDPVSAFSPLRPGTQGNVTFLDSDGGGGLSSGDRISVRVNPGWSYELLVFWQGSLVGQVTWVA